MCGIAGYTGRRIAGKIEAMTAMMIHRGPDDEGFYDDGLVHFGMRRLSIVDLATGQQPKYGVDRSVAVVFNGEIYNHVELRTGLEVRGYRFDSHSSDTEVIAFLYQEHGIEFTEKMIGMFAIALHDRTSGEVFLVRDRLGKKPIYYRYDAGSGTLEFGSEFNLIDVPDRAEHVDRDALAWYFSQKAMPGDASIDRRIRKVPAGCYLRHQPGGPCEIVRYYRVPVPAKPDTDVPSAIARVDALIADSVRLRMRADVEVGAFLSGGVDSSLIVALAAQLTEKPVKTYCLVYDREINEKGSDRRYARLVAERCGTRHREVLLTPQLLMDELPKIVAHYGQPNSAVVSNWFIAREMGRELKVALSGDGADELFGSYFLHRVSAALDRYRRRPDDEALRGLPEAEASFVREHAALPFADWIDRFAVFPDHELRQLLTPAIYRRGRILELIAAREAELASSDPLNRMLEFDCRNLLVDQILNYSDMLSMAHSLEVRTPFLDHRLVDAVFSLDPSLKIRGTETKWLLKQVARRHLPEDLVTRKKEGFVEPAVYWIADEMRDWCRSWLEAPAFNRLGLLNGDYVRDLTARFYRDRDFFDGKRVWSLLMFAIWERGYAGP
jgi:asparagine synthase (glutamine-hydrolysing)